MKTRIEIIKSGYDYGNHTGWVIVPYMSTKRDIVEYLYQIYGPRAFMEHEFVMVTKKSLRYR